MAEQEFSYIGKPVLRQDGFAKVSGKARFAADINHSDQLFGVMVRVPVVHAKIISIDYPAVQNHPAVAAIVDADDIPGTKKIGPIRQDQPIFSFDKIVTAGDAVAMLIGESEPELRQLCDQVRVEYEELPALCDPLKALDKDAPRIHPQYPDNLIVHHPLIKGDVGKAFQQCDEIIEQTYSTSHVEHAYIEPEAVLAIPREDGQSLHIIGSIQNPFTARKVVAAVMNLQLTKIRIEQAELGGSFGGKDDTMNILAARAAVAARKTGRPVKIIYRREESILESYKRHPYIMHYKAGFNRDGKIIAMKIDILADGGAYSSMTPFVTWRSVVQATGPYEIENVRTDVRGVYTNNPYTGAMRGFGSPQPIFAQESLMDEIAARLGKSPDEIRRINMVKQGSVTATGQKMSEHEVTLPRILETAVRETHFAEKWETNRRNQPKKFLNGNSNSNYILDKNDFLDPAEIRKKGIGMAVSLRGCSLGAEGIDAAAAYLSVQTDGSCYLLCGLAENGQGLKTTLGIVAAEELGIKPDDIHYLETNTGNIPDSGPTVASRSTLMGGGAVLQAARTIRSRLEELFRFEHKIPKEISVTFKEGKVFPANSHEMSLSFSELCKLAYDRGINLATIGWYSGPKVDWDEETGQGSAYFTYVYGCQVAEVQVNLATGEVFIEKITAVHDPGKVINLLGALGQVYGGVTQGAGMGLWEDLSTYQGKIREANFDQYLIPTSMDIGEIVPIFIEGNENYGPWGGKSLGEPTLELTSAALNNAITNAVGKRFCNLPVNLEELLVQRKLYPESETRGSAK